MQTMYNSYKRGSFRLQTNLNIWQEKQTGKTQRRSKKSLWIWASSHSSLIRFLAIQKRLAKCSPPEQNWQMNTSSKRLKRVSSDPMILTKSDTETNASRYFYSSSPTASKPDLDFSWRISIISSILPCIIVGRLCQLSLMRWSV